MHALLHAVSSTTLLSKSIKAVFSAQLFQFITKKMSVTFHSLMKKEKDRRQRVKEAKEAKQRLRRKRQPSAQMGKIYRARCDTGAKSAARHSAGE